MQKWMSKRMRKCMLKWLNRFIFAAAFLFFSCVSAKNDFSQVPYLVSGVFTDDIYGEVSPEVIIENPVSDFSSESLFFEFNFTNLSEKTIQSFSIVVFTFDEGGSSLFYERNNLVLKINKCVYPKETYSGCVNLGEVLAFVPQEIPEPEYIYIDRIEFED